MSYNNFSDWYKKALINSEAKIKEMWIKELSVEDVFLEIVKHSSGWIKEICSLYWVNEKLTIEIINKWLFNENPEKRNPSQDLRGESGYLFDYFFQRIGHQPLLGFQGRPLLTTTQGCGWRWILHACLSSFNQNPQLSELLYSTLNP